MAECLFCRIVRGDVPAKKAYEDDRVVVFHDVHPQAPVHVLIIPRQHLTDLLAVEEADEALVGHILRVAGRVAAELGVAESGFRVAVNVGPDAGQSVDHLHFHLLGGRQLGWPPG